jgi:DNA-directed RNA polymerase specialized sigma24 family protein
MIMMRSPSPEEDREKRLRLKSGDPEAFADLFREHQPGILNYLYRLSGGNATLSEDVSQQDRGLEKRELETAIEKTLAALEEPLREVFILSRYHSLKYAQIAQMLGISVKTVEARLSRALQDLQRLLKDLL